jgi:photosystem II stability/assembly factor-like uncharacterized protein
MRAVRATTGGSLRRPPGWLVVTAVAISVVAAGLLLFDRDPPAPATAPVAGASSAAGGPVPWASLGTEDVHSLAFDPADPEHVLFGHHGGVLESTDGGRDWRPLPVREDAMAVSRAGDGSIVVAGHDVLVASTDGETWTAIDSDLPSHDIHGFTRDPGDPTRMWAHLATGGLWETTDGGRHWTRVHTDALAFPIATRRGAELRLLGVDATGVIVSLDGGRSWAPLAVPPTSPLTAVAATTDGAVIYAGSLRELWRSTDGGATWSRTAFTGSALAIATAGDGSTVAVVSRDARYFRSSDGGATWPGPEL